MRVRALLAVALGAAAIAGAAVAAGGLVKVNGHKLFVQCVGTGGPTVLFENGLGDFHGEWDLVVQASTDTGVRMCSYDRFGNGDSQQSRTSSDRTLKQVVSDAHAMVRATKSPLPVVVVGHSMGGLIARYYAKRYPKDVAGMVMIESAPDDWDVYTKTPVYSEGTRLNIAPASKELRKSDRFGKRPLIVIEAQDPSSVASWTGRPVSVFLKYWDARQRALAKISSNSIFFVAKQTNHDVPYTAGTLIAESIRLVVESIRTGEPLPACAETRLPSLGALC
ncbi:MAG: alpha/beta fold hydrolase [Gaiellaceae bacterium]